LSFLPHPATTDIYTLSLHDALPISTPSRPIVRCRGTSAAQPSSAPLSVFLPRCLRLRPLDCSGPGRPPRQLARSVQVFSDPAVRSEEHTSELQSQSNLVCRLLLEKK